MSIKIKILIVIVLVFTIGAGVYGWFEYKQLVKAQDLARSVVTSSYRSYVASYQADRSLAHEYELPPVSNFEPDPVLTNVSGNNALLLLARHPDIILHLAQLNIQDQKKLVAKIEAINAQRSANAKPPAPTQTTSSSGPGFNIPILLYHKPPANFEAELQTIKAKGYTTISMSEVTSILQSGKSPDHKVAVITFDDGFSAQTSSLPLLQKYDMRATYYLITAGERSNWCIGIERHPVNCGDGYMNWGEVRSLVASGRAEVGGHTVDHLSLPSYAADVQTFEIVSNKARLEEMLGLKLTTFAYPYGRYNNNTINIVRSAGYTNAVTTNPGTSQSLNNIFGLYRIRLASQLP